MNEFSVQAFVIIVVIISIIIYGIFIQAISIYMSGFKFNTKHELLIF